MLEKWVAVLEKLINWIEHSVLTLLWQSRHVKSSRSKKSILIAFLQQGCLRWSRGIDTVESTESTSQHNLGKSTDTIAKLHFRLSSIYEACYGWITQRLLRDSRDKPSASSVNLILGLTAVTRFARVLTTKMSPPKSRLLCWGNSASLQGVFIR